MIGLDAEPEVVRLAEGLGLDRRGGAAKAVVRHCRERIDAWLAERPDVATIAQVERLVCGKLKLAIEEVWSDEDLERLVERYKARKEPIFCHLRTDLDGETFGTLIELRDVTPAEPVRYVAVIDCRGEKAARRFFTRWHEIAHLLTMRRLYEFPFHRSTVERDPLERLMDEIAGAIGFHDRLFLPVLREELEAAGNLTLAGVERIRARFCHEASFQASLIACVSRTPAPVISLEAGLGYKKQEKAALASRQKRLFAPPEPVAKLRALVACGNAAARSAGLRIDRNMEVPSSSVIYGVFHDADDDADVVRTGRESLAAWTHSDGRPVGTAEVEVEARRTKDRVVALIRPASPHAYHRRSR